MILLCNRGVFNLQEFGRSVEDQKLSEGDKALLDRVVTLTLADNASFAKVHSTHENYHQRSSLTGPILCSCECIGRSIHGIMRKKKGKIY